MSGVRILPLLGAAFWLLPNSALVMSLLLSLGVLLVPLPTRMHGGKGVTCERCHGPGKQHAEGGDVTLIF